MKKAIAISILLHIFLVAVLVYISRSIDAPFGDNIVSVELTNGPATHSTATNSSKSVGRLITKSVGRLNEVNTNDIGQNEIIGLGAGSPNGNWILSKIRNKIEGARYYPPEARRQRLEGKSSVSFEIAEDGSVSNLAITRSSGNPLLDDAALETIRRAAPFPYYEGPINLALKFSLSD
jgi:protein TonB